MVVGRNNGAHGRMKGDFANSERKMLGLFALNKGVVVWRVGLSLAIKDYESALDAVTLIMIP